MNLNRFIPLITLIACVALLGGCASKDFQFTGGGGTSDKAEAVLGLVVINAAFELNTKERKETKRVVDSLTASLKTASKGRITGVGVAKAFESASKALTSDRSRRIVYSVAYLERVFIGDVLVSPAAVTRLVQKLETLSALLPV